MKKERLDEIKKELEKLVEFREGTGIIENSFFGNYQGTSITLAYDGDYSNIWIGKMDDKFKVNLSMTLMECTVKIGESKMRFYSQDCIIVVGE